LNSIKGAKLPSFFLPNQGKATENPSISGGTIYFSGLGMYEPIHCSLNPFSLPIFPTNSSKFLPICWVGLKLSFLIFYSNFSLNIFLSLFLMRVFMLILFKLILDI